MRGVVCLALMLSMAGGCTASSAPPNRPSQNPTVEVATFTRPCESAVWGDLGPTWRRNASVSGPVALVGVAAYRNAPAKSFAPRNGRFPSLKVLVVVERGSPTTLMVSAFDRQPVRLLYDESAWRDDNRYRLSEGDRAVTFEPCDDRRATQFNGSFLMRGPRCVGLEVWVEGERQARALQVPFGRVSC